MNELRVVFVESPGQGYHAQLADARGRRLGAEVPFTPFLTEDDYEGLRWYLEEYMDLPDGGAVVRAQRIERELERWGSQLYGALFTEADNRDFLKELLAGPEPRRLTIATRDPALLRLPWELIADEEGSLAQRLSVRRQLEEPREITPVAAQLPLRILYIVSRPTGAGFIDPRLTAKALLDALEPLGTDVRVDFCRPPTLERMEEMLSIQQDAGDPYDIVHFDGHGNFSQEEQVGVLFFEEPAAAFGKAAVDPVSATDLGDLLASYSIRLVLLEACRTATLSPTTVFGSVAPSLILAGVGSVLAMSHTVHVEATRVLMDCFYRELIQGATIDEAVSAARKALWGSPRRWLKAGPDGRTIDLQDWFLPHLYHRAVEEALVPSTAHHVAESANSGGFRSPATREEVGAFPPPPQFGFRGRARELHALERLFRAERGLVLHAMGGMGKTALATEAAHWWTRSGLFRDGACFLSFEQFMSADRVVQVLGTYLAGLTFDQLPADAQRQRAIELFQQKSVLLVWDNFESVLPQFNSGAAGLASPYTDDERRRLAKLFYDLTEGSGNGCLLVTCRPGVTGLPGAQRYELQGLARADSLWLLASILEREGLTLAEPRLSRESLEPLLRDLADHPLSLELVGPHLRTMRPEEICADFGKLLAEFRQDVPEERNQSLLASLEFSLRHLSPAAREALPWLGLFSGGVFEDLLLRVSQLAPEAWDPIRKELQRIALIRPEDDVEMGGRPFLRFHPTLASSATDPTLARAPEIRQRFLGVYAALRQALDKALSGSQPRAALEVLNREEANYRTAAQWAVADQQLPTAAALGRTFCEYLEWSLRRRESDAWVQWLKDAMGQQSFTEDAAGYKRQHAWTLFDQGDLEGAVEHLQALIERLHHTTEFDPSFELAATVGMLGRVLDHAGATTQAIPILLQALRKWEVLVEKAGGQSWEEILASADYAKAGIELGNLSATMCDLANALRKAGKYDEALGVADQCLGIQQKLDNHRDIAAVQGLSASILTEAGRYDEAEARYDLLLTSARHVGDKQLEGAALQHQGDLAVIRNQFERASRLYQQALEPLLEAGYHQGVRQTYILLGVAERKAGRLAEALAWYEKSRELAVQLKDRHGLAQAAHNIGVIWLQQGEATRERGDEPAARWYFEEARRSVEESLQVWQSQKNKPDEAASWGELARIQLRLGDLATAELHAHEARKICESLGLKKTWKSYNNLFEIAQARGDLIAAAKWAKKRDDLRVELAWRAKGGDAKALQALTLACARAGFGDGSIGPAEERALARLDSLPASFPKYAELLRHLAAGQVPPVPAGWPVEFRNWMEELVEAIREAQG